MRFKVAFAFLGGMFFESLLIALRHEQFKFRRETILYLQEGTNIFWVYPLLLFGMILILFIVLGIIYRKNKSKDKQQEDKSNGEK